MQQQVNLFQPMFRKERKLFSFDTSMRISIVFLFALLALYIFNWRNVDQTREGIKRVKEQNTIHLSQLANITQKIKEQGGDKDVKDRVDLLRSELEAERYILRVLGNQYSQHRLGFSSYLEGFARRSIKGMWLSSFEMKNGGQSVQLTGGTLSPEIIPDFLSGLSDEPALSGTTFEVLTMARETPGRNWIEFSLSSGDISDSPFGLKP